MIDEALKCIGSLLLAASLCGCASQITRDCYRAHPMPNSLATGSMFGLIGVGLAYAMDGKAIAEADRARDECVAKAAIE